jgi:sulfatase maturation enzyme AslB (radical SAM superfamily)
MQLSGLHILLTYQCNYECDHCFVWGGPRQTGVLTYEQVENVLLQAKETGVTSIYFEGGEPFLYYPILVKAVRKAAEMGFSVGIVSNAYWAITPADAEEWLKPFAGLLTDLTVSSDLFHCDKAVGEYPQNAQLAAEKLNIPTGMISIDQPDVEDGDGVMYRGRAAKELVKKAVSSFSWDIFDSCPHEDLRDPGRIHLDPLGNLHICQGISIGNLFEKPLKEICEKYDAESHPICGLLLAGGPAALVNEYNLPHASHYADACHLCYEARIALRELFPQHLTPDQMYGVVK